MDFQTITYATGGGIARITLNRPDRLNAISPELLQDLDRRTVRPLRPGRVRKPEGLRLLTQSADARR